ncbi:hypothetical protein [Nocardia caishijiensis]|uniref:Uncharacterized protein n=1 Tax=Nocardia caishijiensis TaxID=184756 RepID=A0ABQ6YUX3_9NOCA|nr:hypothetical protein [Nocardia caishijiensis]KAF0849365.1 hypothetical protein FNL39_101803 [Nocardia caishijiensis]
MIRLDRADGVLTVVPGDGPLVTDALAPLDAMVLEVVGGHLSWSILDDRRLPAAVLDDPEGALDWLWAVYGESAALAVADGVDGEHAAEPARPDLVASLRRLAYAHWASRWWPASMVDGIPALDTSLLDEEIRQLTAICEMVLADSELVGLAPVDLGQGDPSARQAGSDPGADQADSGSATSRRPDQFRGDSSARAEDYALAAGGERPGDGLIVAHGSGDWDWRRCPPGLLDTGADALSWTVTRTSGVSTARVTVVAAPNCPRHVPEHLRPHVRLEVDNRTAVTAELQLRMDNWSTEVQLPGSSETFTALSIFVPGVGPSIPYPDESALRAHIRDFARGRLTGQAGDHLLAAESAAADSDDDF